ncbi:MAG TPA: cytochrome c [Chitinophagales bacterium]|nr:cytochrome c [Chitinophagales bacterium]
MRKYFLLLSIPFSLSLVLAFRFSDGERWRAPEDARKLINPLQPSGEIISDGKYLFRQNCKACHGPFGKGDGPVAHTLKAQCADLTSAPVQQQTDGELYYKLSIGRLEMPGFKDLLKPDERWALIHYIRTLKESDMSER